MEKLLHVHAKRWKRRSRRTLNMLRTSRKHTIIRSFGVGSDVFMKDFRRTGKVESSTYDGLGHTPSLQPLVRACSSSKRRMATKYVHVQ